MARYIDADKLLEELQEEIEFESSMYTEEQNKWFNIGLKCAVRDVKHQPTADVEEVKRSRWENISGFDVCNICGASPAYCEPKPNNPKGYPPYCPNCGAKMDGTPKERGGEK